MADNIDSKTAANVPVATDVVTYSGDAGQNVQLVRPVLVTGTEGSKTVVDLPGEATYGLDVDVTRLPSLVAGTANIGDVDVLTVPEPLSTTGGGTEATALRVTLANDSTGLVSVDDNSASLSVDWNGTQPVTGSGTATGALRVELANNGTGLVGLNAGSNAIGKLAANTGVDIGDVDVTSVVPGTGATNSGKAVDAVAGATDTGVAMLAVRIDTPAAITPAAGDYTRLFTSSTGRLWTSSAVTDVTPGTGTGSLGKQEGAGHTAGNTGVLLLGVRNTDHSAFTGVAQGDYAPINVDAEGCVVTVGNIAHDTADADPPIKVGAKAIAGISTLTLVAAADRTNLFAGTDGVLIVRNHCGVEDIVSGTASNTDGARFQVLASSGAGVRTYLTQITIANTSTAMITCSIDDGTTPAYVLPVPAQGGVTVSFDPPLRGTAATAWQCDPSAANTTTYCSMVGFKSKA